MPESLSPVVLCSPGTRRRSERCAWTPAATTLSEKGWGSLARTYVHCGQDRTIPLPAEIVAALP
jgi:hypothetical protein